jgi:hypothetical protein
MGDPFQLPPSVVFLHLTIDQAWFHMPPEHIAPSATQREPLAKVGRQCIKVEIEAVTGEERETAGSQDLSESVDELMGHGLCSGTELKHGQNFGARIDGQPQLKHLGGAAQPGSQFAQLQMWELEVAERVHV